MLVQIGNDYVAAASTCKIKRKARNLDAETAPAIVRVSDPKRSSAGTTHAIALGN
jgi:hypothetical protein